jgi:aspartyl-tRNA(Asn)/glutamyl-tRNA(Gln) amidotransferase subunit C
MTLTLEEVEHIAELARLHLTEAEKARYREQLSAILDYFEQFGPWTPPTFPYLSVLRRSVLRDQPAWLDWATWRNAPDTEGSSFGAPCARMNQRVHPQPVFDLPDQNTAWTRPTLLISPHGNDPALRWRYSSRQLTLTCLERIEQVNPAFMLS